MKDMSTKMIEMLYKQFLSENIELKDFDSIDFFGINISEDDIVFKIYFSSEVTTEQELNLLSPLYKKEMIGVLNKVKDTNSSRKARIDAQLKNRTNRNMLFLYEWLKDVYPDLSKYDHQIEEFKKLQCSKDSKYHYASLYFLGIISNSYDIIDTQAVKLHYILRHCSDTNHIGNNYIVDNNTALSAIKSMDIPIMQKLACFADKCLTNCNAEIWIAAADYYRNQSNKYKIYFKSFSQYFYESLYQQLITEGLEKLGINLKHFHQWLITHFEYEVYGLAVCCSEDYKWSLNFYLNKKM